jgi:antitoxin component of RelBE/YafQ-DinJ toxin-antitoxin module
MCWDLSFAKYTKQYTIAIHFSQLYMPTTTQQKPLKRKPKVITTIRLDPDMKRAGQIITRNMGIDLSTFFTIKLTELVTTRELNTGMREVASPEVLAELRQVEQDIAAGVNMSPVFTNAKDAITYLHSL